MLRPQRKAAPMKQPSFEAVRKRYAFLDDGAGQVHDAIHKIDAVLTGPMMDALVKSPISEYYQRTSWEHLMDAYGKFLNSVHVALDLCEIQFKRELAEAEAVEKILEKEGEKE